MKKKGFKRIATSFAIIALIAGGGALIGCDQTKESGSNQTTTTDSSSNQEKIFSNFDVSPNVDASYGSTYTLPTFTPVDQNGNVYSVMVSVVCDGKTVTIVSNKIDINTMKDYVVTYKVEGVDLSKTMTIHVVDSVLPTIEVSGLKKWYTVNQTIELPTISVIDNVDEELAYSIDVYQGETKTLSDVKASFTLAEAGKYQMVISAKDSSNNEAKKPIDFIVRDAAATGEIEDFEDPLAFDCVTAWNNNDTSLIGKEAVEHEGKKAIKISSTDTAGAPVKYPGLALTPRISKIEAQELLDAGFDKISIEYFIDYDTRRIIYQRWNTQQSYATVLNEWSTVNLPLDIFVEKYDDIAAQKVSLFYIGNDAEYVDDKVCADFDFYVSSIYATKTLDDVTFADGNLDNKAAVGDTIDASKIVASSANAPDLEVKYEYLDPSGEPISLTDNSFVVSDFGIYTIVATSSSKCYKFEKRYEINVKATPASINALIKKILESDNMSSMTVEALNLKNYYETLTAEEKATIDRFDYIKASNLLQTKADELFYFDTEAGKQQISLGMNVDVKLNTTKGIQYVTDVKYGQEAGSTKVTFADATSEWCGPFIVYLDTPSDAILADYAYVNFYVQGYCYNQARPITFAVTKDGTRISPTLLPVVAANGEWVRITIPTSAFSGEVALRFYTNSNGNLYGSVWNDPTRMYAYLSSFTLVKDANLMFDEAFVTTNLTKGDTLSLANMSASNSDKTISATKYVMKKPDNTTEEVNNTMTYTFELSGTYVLTAYYDGEVYGTISKEINVAVSDELDLSLASVSAQVAEMKGVGYGTDVAVNTVLNSYQGKENVLKVDTTPANGASSNSFKWPGISVLTTVTEADLLKLKEAGYVNLTFDIYIEGGKDQVLKHGNGDTKICDAKNGEWTTVTITTDALITHLEKKGNLNYLFYVDNGAQGPYVIFYVTDLVFAK